MQNKLQFEAKHYIVLILVLITATITFLLLFSKNDTIHILRSSGYNVDIKDTTYRGFASQKILADKGDEQVVIQIVKGVAQSDSDSILLQFNEPVQNIQQKVVITDPYSGRKRELSIPESLKPIKEDVVIKGTPITYYIVYANDILSVKIFSEAEAKKRGVFSTFYCPKEKAVYALEIYSNVEHFDKQKQISVLSSLYCR